VTKGLFPNWPDAAELQEDISPTEWIPPRLLPWGRASGTRIASLVPLGYAAYARVLHPALGRDGETVTWKRVVVWSARTYHPLMQFDRISKGVAQSAARPFEQAPRAGDLFPLASCKALYSVLTGFTLSPDRCWLGVWDGYGQLAYPKSAAVIVATGANRSQIRDESPRLHRRSRRLARRQATPKDPDFATQWAEMSERIGSAPRFELPGRRYLLATAPVGEACEFSTSLGNSPNLAWPEDRSWFVATEVDLDSTLVAGERSCIDALLANEMLEVLEVQPEDRLDVAGDLLNPE
jgi:hypothetical protein